MTFHKKLRLLICVLFGHSKEGRTVFVGCIEFPSRFDILRACFRCNHVYEELIK